MTSILQRLAPQLFSQPEAVQEQPPPAVTGESVSMWSPLSNAIVTWRVSVKREYDFGSNLHTWIQLDHDQDPPLKFSPNTSDEELARFVKDVNRRHSFDRNAPEVD